LQQSCYSDFLRSLILFIFITALRSSEKRKRNCILFFLWILLLLESLTTFEYIIYLSLFFVLFGKLFKDKENILSKKEIFILIMALPSGLLLHFLQNVWYFGSFRLALKDLKDIAIIRIFHSTDAPPMNFFIWWKYVILRNLSLVFVFDFFILFLCIFLSYILYHKLTTGSKEQIKSLFRLWIVLGICGVSWYLVFPSHSWAHTFLKFLARHIVPFAALGFTIFFYIIFSFIQENFSTRYYLMAILSFIIVIMIFTGIMNSDLPLTREKIIMSVDFIKFKECLRKLKESSQAEDKIGINYYRFPFIRYYTNRSCVSIFDKVTLDNSTILPRYFIFISRNNPTSQQLFEYLEQKYVHLWKCDSLRFPAIFFKLKNNE